MEETIQCNRGNAGQRNNLVDIFCELLKHIACVLIHHCTAWLARKGGGGSYSVNERKYHTVNQYLESALTMIKCVFEK